MASQFPGDRPPPVTPSHTGVDTAGLIARVRNLVTQPKAEWPRIDAAPMTEKDIYLGVVAPLAAIPAVAGLIGSQLFPVRVPGLGLVLRQSLSFAIGNAIGVYLVAFIATFLSALAIAALAPQFGAVNDRLKATKLVAFTFAPVWVLGIINILPGLGGLLVLVLLIAAGYAIYLLYLGLPLLMKAPADKTAGYVGVSVFVMLVVYLLAGAIVGQIVGALTPAPTLGSITVR